MPLIGTGYKIPRDQGDTFQKSGAMEPMTLQTSSIRKRLLLGGTWALTGKVMTAVTGLAVNILLARLLAPDEMGAYFLTFSLVSVAALVAQLGLSQTVVRLVAESIGKGKPGRARAAVRLVFRYTALGAVSVMAFLVLGGGHWFAEKVFRSSIMAGVVDIAAVWVIVLTLQEVLAETFRGFHDVRRATLFGGLVTGGLSATLFGFLWFLEGHAALGEILALSVASGAANVSLGWFFLGRITRDLQGDDPLGSQEVLSIAWSQWISNLMLIALTQADIWVLGIFRSQDEVALYGAASRLVALVAMPLLIVNAVVPPLIAEMYAQGKKKELERVLRTTATVAGVPSFVVLLGLILFGNWVLSVVYGDFYRSGGVVLVLLSLGQLVNVWSGSCGLTLIMTGNQSTLMLISLFSGSAMIVGSIISVKSYGVAGVAGIAALMMIIQNLLMLFFAKARSGIWTHVRFSSLIPLYREFTR